MEILQYWKIIIELALLWYVIYMILLFVKGTRSEQLLKGLLLIGIIYVLTQQLKLAAINWVLARILPISVIALIVIFQPELRRALAQLGQFGLHQENVEAIDEISRAAVTLSRKKIGALIVIEREAGLKSYMESGTIIDAAITSHLLTTIFITQSVLHDGAVIIERGRIAAAGCVLPLTQEDQLLPKSFGMRHRAAIGITEETDAVSVVVSEETGAISVASAGKLTHGLDEESLIKILKNAFYHPSKKRMPFHIVQGLNRKTKSKGAR